MAKKKTGKKQTISPKVYNDNEKLDKILVENFVSLQKIMVNLSIKLENLTKQISDLLELFEISAKVLAEKESVHERNSKDTEKVIKKIDTLLDQNKIIARGLTLMHEKMPESPQNQQNQHKPQHPHPEMQMHSSQFPSNIQNKPAKPEEYQKSISSSQNLE